MAGPPLFEKVTRRDFLKMTALTGAAALLASCDALGDGIVRYPDLAGLIKDKNHEKDPDVEFGNGNRILSRTVDAVYPSVGGADSETTKAVVTEQHFIRDNVGKVLVLVDPQGNVVNCPGTFANSFSLPALDSLVAGNEDELNQIFEYLIDGKDISSITANWSEGKRSDLEMIKSQWGSLPESLPVETLLDIWTTLVYRVANPEEYARLEALAHAGGTDGAIYVPRLDNLYGIKREEFGVKFERLLDSFRDLFSPIPKSDAYIVLEPKQIMDFKEVKIVYGNPTIDRNGRIKDTKNVTVRQVVTKGSLPEPNRALIDFARQLEQTNIQEVLDRGLKIEDVETVYKIPEQYLKYFARTDQKTSSGMKDLEIVPVLEIPSEGKIYQIRLTDRDNSDIVFSDLMVNDFGGPIEKGYWDVDVTEYIQTLNANGVKEVSLVGLLTATELFNRLALLGLSEDDNSILRIDGALPHSRKLRDMMALFHMELAGNPGLIDQYKNMRYLAPTEAIKVHRYQYTDVPDFASKILSGANDLLNRPIFPVNSLVDMDVAKEDDGITDIILERGEMIAVSTITVGDETIVVFYDRSQKVGAVRDGYCYGVNLSEIRNKALLLDPINHGLENFKKAASSIAIWGGLLLYFAAPEVLAASIIKSSVTVKSVLNKAMAKVAGKAGQALLDGLMKLEFRLFGGL